MMLLKVAARNILRNARRSVITGSAITLGVLAMLLFGGFIGNIFAALETDAVQRTGHLVVFRTGYFTFGSGNPAAYGIPAYQDVMHRFAADARLQPLVRVMTPTQSLLGIAGNFSGGVDAAKTFLGVGVVPSNQLKMRDWNEYAISTSWPRNTLLADDAPQRGVVGRGMARILGLCGPLKIADCPALPMPQTDGSAAPDNTLTDLAQSELGDRSSSSDAPRLDLLGATSGGAPNVVSMEVAGVVPQGVKELDDNYIAMPLPLAQQLVYGRGEHKATAIVLQLNHTRDMAAARAALQDVIERGHLDLEVKAFSELNPFYGQVVGMFSAIFLFITLIMGVIVLFAVVNTMTMNVVERTNEIGTIRAMGVRRGGIRRQFLLEGCILGIVSATIGVLLAFIATALINQAGWTWTPPGNVSAVPFQILPALSRPVLLAGTWCGLVGVATLAALLPANRAARLPIVDALRHV